MNKIVLYTLLLVLVPVVHAAITVTLLTNDSNSADNTFFTTQSITPTASSLVLVSVDTYPYSGNGTPSSVVGNSITYTYLNGTCNSGPCTSLWYGMSASPTTGSITITFPVSQYDTQWIVNQAKGVNTSGTNGAGAIAQAPVFNGTTVTLSPLLLATDVAFGSFFAYKPATLTVGLSYNLSGAGVNASGNTVDMDEYQQGAVVVNESSSGATNSGVAVELRDASPSITNLYAASIDTYPYNGNVTTSTVACYPDMMLTIGLYYGGNLSNPYGVSGCGLTWTYVTGGNIGVPYFAEYLWHGFGTPTTSGNISIGLYGRTLGVYILDGVNNSVGTANSLGIPLTVNGTSSSLSLTLTTLNNANSIAYGSFLGHVSSGIIAGYGFAKVNDTYQVEHGWGVMTEDQINTVTVNASNLNDYNIGLGVEIRAMTSSPVISSVVNDTITDVSARIGYNTDINGNSSINYGKTTDLGTLSNDATFNVIHNTVLNGLSQAQIYYYNITSCNAIGGCSMSGTYNFTTKTTIPAITPRKTFISVGKRLFINVLRRLYFVGARRAGYQ